MDIAITGIRGVPAVYGGPETCAKEVAVRLAARGHRVTAYCRPGYYDDTVKEFEGVRRVVLPTIRTTATETYFHTLISLLHMIPRRPDVILIFNPGAGGLAVVPRVFGIPVVLNPDGFDWRRAKWGPFARWFIKNNARLSTKVCNQLITDSITIRDFYNDAWRCTPPARYIPYGAPVETLDENADDGRILEKYGVEDGRYFFFLSRHVPENTCEEILEGFRRLEARGVKLLFGGGGDSPYATELRRFACDSIVMPGIIKEERDVAVLHRHCFAVIHGNQPGGTSLGLLKAMGYGCCVATPDTIDNSFVVGDAGYTYATNPDAIHDTLRQMLDHPEEVRAKGRRALERIREHYDWDHVTDQYVDVIESVVQRRGRPSTPA